MCDLGRVTRGMLSCLSLTLTLRRGRCPALKMWVVGKPPMPRYQSFGGSPTDRARIGSHTNSTMIDTVERLYHNASPHDVGIVSLINKFVK